MNMELVQKLIVAQDYAMRIRPRVGGFPVLAEVLRKNGIIKNRWMLPSCQSVFYFNDDFEHGVVVQQGTPLVMGMHAVHRFNKEALIQAIRADQNGLSSFPEFLKSAWAAGVIEYEVDFIERKVVYSGINGVYIEEYPVSEMPV